MTAVEELQAGSPGTEFVRLLHRTIWAVAIARNFPPPEGHPNWTGEALTSTVGVFFASSQTARRLSDLSSHCTTQQALERRLQTVVRNFLADLGRQTEVGRLVRRINEVLVKEQAFVRRGECWTMAGLADEAAVTDLDALAMAIRNLSLSIPTVWRKSSARKSPEIGHASVIELATAILKGAGGPLRPGLIAQVIARRLGLGQTPLSLDATAFDPPQGGQFSDATAVDVMLEMRAEEVFGLLNDSERAALGLLDLGTAALGQLLGVSKATAHNIRSRARAILTRELLEEENGQEVATAVLDLAGNWVRSVDDGP